MTSLALDRSIAELPRQVEIASTPLERSKAVLLIE
jgi:hypothetical protein